MIQVHLQDPKTIALEMSGEITADDYKRARPVIESFLAKQGKMKFLFDLSEATGFTVGSVFEDIKTDIANFKNIGSTAVVSDSKIANFMTSAMDKIYPEKIEHFKTRSEAEKWIGHQIH